MKLNKLSTILCLSFLLTNCSGSDTIPEKEEPVEPEEEPEEIVQDYTYSVAQVKIETLYGAPILGKEKEHYVEGTVQGLRGKDEEEH